MGSVCLVLVAVVHHRSIVGFVDGCWTVIVEVDLEGLSCVLYGRGLLAETLILVPQRLLVVRDVLTHVQHVRVGVVVAFVRWDRVVLLLGIKRFLVVNFLNFGVMLGVLLDLLMLRVLDVDVYIVEVDFSGSRIGIRDAAAKTGTVAHGR